MSAPTFILPVDCDPLAASETDNLRPGLKNGQVVRVVNPLTGEKAVYLATSDSYIAAYVPLVATGWRHSKPLLVSPAAIRAAQKNGHTFEGDGDRMRVGKDSFAPIDGKSGPLNKIVPKPIEQPLASEEAWTAFDLDLLTRLTTALGYVAGAKKRRAIKVYLTAPLKPLIVEVWGCGGFGLLMPIRTDGK